MPLLWPDAASFRASRAGASASSAPSPRPSGPLDRVGGRAFANPAGVLAHLAALFSILVLLSPGIDLLVSGWFAGPEGGFPLADSGPLIALRDLNRMLPPMILVSLMALLVAQGFGLRSARLPRPHVALFILAFYAAGPGLIVNGLKTLVGRARPRHITEFGGTDLFTSAWQASSACARNCSFPSGEAGSGMAMLALVFLLPRPWRGPVLVLLVPLAVAFSLNRILFGAHFLSDVVLAWLLCGAVMLAFRPVFASRADAIDAAVTGAFSRRTTRRKPSNITLRPEGA